MKTKTKLPIFWRLSISGPTDMEDDYPPHPKMARAFYTLGLDCDLSCFEMLIACMRTDKLCAYE